VRFVGKDIKYLSFISLDLFKINEEIPKIINLFEK